MMFGCNRPKVLGPLSLPVRRIGLTLLLLATPTLLAASSASGRIQSSSQPNEISIIIAEDAHRLEKLAASELRSYLKRLYGADVELRSQMTPGNGGVFLIGSPGTNAVLEKWVPEWPQLSDQGLLLRRVRLEGQSAVVVGGGSPLATLWSVYELVEKLGVRYLLWGDLLPEGPGEFRLPDIDELKEPIFRARAFRGINDFVMGPEAWSLREYERVIKQLVKLKYNHLWLSFYSYQPFVDYEFRGHRKEGAELWFGWQYPIGEDTIGRELFQDATEFVHPEFEGAVTYKQRVAAGQRYVHGILKLARDYGMKTGILFSATDPPQEFKQRLQEWTPLEYKRELSPEETPEFGYVGVKTMGADPRNTAFQNVFNPVFADLAEVIIQAHVNTYPEADYYIIHTPEFRAPVSGLESCWQRLDEKYDLESRASLEKMLDSARARSGRAGRELGGDIEFLYFLDHLFTERKVMAKTKHPEATVMISGVTRELFPLLSAILPSHFEALVAPGVYTTVESAKALHTLAPFQQGSLNAHFWLTLQGDSMSVLPQLPSSSVYQSLQAMQQYGLDGYMVRYWTLGDLVPTSAYLARASWELTDPETFYRKHLDTICGREAVDEVINAFDSIDEATRFLAQRRHGKWIIYGNPMPGLLEEHYHVEKADYPELDKAIAIYRRALDHLRRASDRSTDQGKDYLEYFMARSEMAIDYLRLLQTVRELGVAFGDGQQARRQRDPSTVLKKRIEVKDLAARSVKLARSAVTHFARVVRDESDLGMLLSLNNVLYRHAKSRAFIMEQEAERGFPIRGVAKDSR